MAEKSQITHGYYINGVNIQYSYEQGAEGNHDLQVSSQSVLLTFETKQIVVYSNQEGFPDLSKLNTDEIAILEKIRGKLRRVRGLEKQIDNALALSFISALAGHSHQTIKS